MLYSTVAKGIPKSPAPVLPVGFDPEDVTATSSVTTSATTATTTAASKKAKSATSPIDTTKLKTRLCRHFMDTQHCPFGDKCAFAHGHEQMSPTDAPQPTTAAPTTTTTTTTAIAPILVDSVSSSATSSKSSFSDSEECSPTSLHSSVDIPAPRSRAAAAAAATSLRQLAVASVAEVTMCAVPRSVSRSEMDSFSALPHTTTVGPTPSSSSAMLPRYDAASRTASRISIGGLSDADFTPQVSLRRRPKPGAVISRVPSTTAVAGGNNNINPSVRSPTSPLPPTYEASMFSDVTSANSTDGIVLSSHSRRAGGAYGSGGGPGDAFGNGSGSYCPPNCTCPDCSAMVHHHQPPSLSRYDSVNGDNWQYHSRRDGVTTPTSQVTTSSPTRSRIQSPMAAGGSGRFTFNPYDPVTPYVIAN